ncbi:MAG: hypothetical protein H5T61_10215 [Thermoflexales bacterium]|nr:hypothetical protein [Thermoflexales bacterium]
MTPPEEHSGSAGEKCQVASSRNSVPIRLTGERWQHITGRHPEMARLQEQVLETVAEPDLVQQGDFGELLAIRFYPETPLTSKFLVVAYREIGQEDGFILTAYLTNRPSQRRTVLWKR